MDNDDQRREYLIQAVRAAMQNVRRHANAPFGAVIARDGRIIATKPGKKPRLPRDNVRIGCVSSTASCAPLFSSRHTQTHMYDRYYPI